MGTLRRETKSAGRAGHGIAELAAKPKRVKPYAEEAEPESRLKAPQVELAAQRVEKALLDSCTQYRKDGFRMRELRGADAAKPEQKGSAS